MISAPLLLVVASFLREAYLGRSYATAASQPDLTSMRTNGIPEFEDVEVHAADGPESFQMGGPALETSTGCSATEWTSSSLVLTASFQQPEATTRQRRCTLNPNA
ncbi:hypothetical protein CGCFRS4_v013751 [Colletotrichum fructicola]|nr:hypothetical protein CFRS1_v005771 [Colletotrichum fructicola]KAF4883259.1 hypothetical protein CGCFRS4_v013751 [Colletotrichum fructicola]